jgi:HK97 family phage portal protein
MGLFSRIKKRRELRTIIKEYYGGDIGWFARSYASSIYDIPEVRTAIECFSDIFSTIPKYIERVDRNGNITYFETQASRVLTLKANPLQNATQFWKDVTNRIMLDNNVFIEPIFDNSTGELKQLYVLPRDNFAFELSGDVAKVRFLTIGKTYNLENLIYINRFANISGGKKNNLGLYETVVQSLAQQAINVANPRKVKALLQSKIGANGNLKPTDKKGTMQDVKANFDDNVNGLAYLDSVWSVTPVNWTENDVNRELMQFVINIVYNYFSITQEIINNKASEIEFQLFVKNRIEPLARQIEQEFTSKLFTKREIEFGNRVELDTFNLSVSTLTAKTALFNVGLRQGVLKIDDAREMIGLAPLPDGLGQKIRVTADTVDITIADKYQLGKFKIKEEENENGTKNTETV